jgi:Clp amino terminal domain, pathogenicity island component
MAQPRTPELPEFLNPHSLGARALKSLGISLEAVRQQVEEEVGRGQQPPSGRRPPGQDQRVPPRVR